MNAVKLCLCCLLAGLLLTALPGETRQNTQPSRRDFNSAVLKTLAVTVKQIPPEQTGTWQEIINNGIFTVFRSPELYRGEISIRIAEDENVSLRFYPDGIFEISTGLLDFIDETLFISAANSARRMRQIDTEREKMLIPFIAAEAGLFAADAEFSAYSGIAENRGMEAADKAAEGRTGSDFLVFSERETFLADITALSILSTSGTFLSYEKWLEYIYDESESNPRLKKYTARFPSYKTRVENIRKEISSPANAVVKLNTIVNSLKTGLGSEEASKSADDLEEKIPELVYLYRLKALLAHRDWERSAFKNGGDPKAVSILPFAQSLDFETDSVLKTMVENSYSGGSFFGSLNENGTIPGNERLYNRALDSYRKVLEYYDDFTIRSACAFLSAQNPSESGTGTIIASAAEAALKEAGTSSVIARTNYARLLFLTGKDLPLASKMMEEIFSGNGYTQPSKKESSFSYVSPGFPGDSRTAAFFYAEILKQNGKTGEAKKIIEEKVLLMPQSATADENGGGKILFKSVGLGDTADTTASLWGEPSEIEFNTKSETWTYPDLYTRIIFVPVPDKNEESGTYEGSVSAAVMLKFFNNSPVSLPGEIRTGDTRKVFESTFGMPSYKGGDSYVYFHNGLRFKVFFSKGNTDAGEEKIRSVSVSF